MRSAGLGVVALTLIGCGVAPLAVPAPAPASAPAATPATTPALAPAAAPVPIPASPAEIAPSPTQEPVLVPGPTALEGEFATIRAEYAALEEAAIQARHAPDPEETARLRGRAQDVAVRAEHAETGLEALCWLLVHPPRDRDTRATLQSWTVQRAIADHLHSPHLDTFARLLGGWAGRTVPHGQSGRALRRIVRESPHESVRAHAKVALATNLVDLSDGGCPGDEGWEEALALLQEVVREYPETPAAAAARPPLTEMTCLQVGGRAPEFEARDVEGRSFRLSDYRGRVVVVEFWGFW